MFNYQFIPLTQEQRIQLNEMLKTITWKSYIFSRLEWFAYHKTEEYQTLCDKVKEAELAYKKAQSYSENLKARDAGQCKISNTGVGLKSRAGGDVIMATESECAVHDCPVKDLLEKTQCPLSQKKESAEQELSDKQTEYKNLKLQKKHFLGKGGEKPNILQKWLDNRKYEIIESYVYDSVKGASFKEFEDYQERYTSASWNKFFAKGALVFAKLRGKNIDVFQNKFNQSKEEYDKRLQEYIQQVLDISKAEVAKQKNNVLTK